MSHTTVRVPIILPKKRGKFQFIEQLTSENSPPGKYRQWQIFRTDVYMEKMILQH